MVKWFKTSPSQGGAAGSIPVRAIKIKSADAFLRIGTFFVGLFPCMFLVISSSRSPYRERHKQVVPQIQINVISIHAPHTESDLISFLGLFISVTSIHALHTESDDVEQLNDKFLTISIHAPHTESDDI